MIAVRLEPHDEERLAKLAAERGETVEETARRLLLDRLYEGGWSEISDDELARSCESMAAEVMPNEDWSDFDTEAEPHGSR